MLLLYLLSPVPVQTLRNAAFDQYQRWQPRPYSDSPVLIVDVDEESLARVGQWPWTRTRLADLVERLHAAGATAIGFDVVFAEPDRTAPRAMAAEWRLSGTDAARIAALPDPDERFAAAMRGARVVLGLTVENGGTAPSGGQSTHRIVSRGDAALSSLPAFDSATLPIPALRSAAAGIGSISFQPDPDGIVRRVPMLVRLPQEIVPSMIAEVLRVSLAERNYVATGLAERPGLRSLRIGRHQIPTSPDGEAWIHYSRPAPQRYLPAWRILDGSAPETALRGRIVLVGTSAKGLLDLRFNPLGAAMPGVEAHAQLLEQIHAGHFLERPAWATAVEALAIAIGGLLVATLALRTGPLSSASATLAALLAIAAASWWSFIAWRQLVDPTLPVIALLLTFVAGSLVRHRGSERRHRWIRHAFSRYVSPNLVSHLVDNPGQLVLGGRRQHCSFIFTDLAGFTSLMERTDPGEAVSLLNDYLDGMIAIVFRHEGTLDRIVGDALAVVFSAPVEQPDHRRRAYECALDLHRFAQAHVEDLARQGVEFGRTRIGVHSGEVIVGNFGGSTIFDYRALGDPVNTAARLETLNKQLGTLVCVSDAIRDDCPGAFMRAVGDIVLKGRTQPLRVFEPLLHTDGTPLTENDSGYDEAYALMAAQDPRALSAFEQLAAERPGDALVAWQLNRLRSEGSGALVVMAEK
nr:adenylate/guanylate cyclase domain-containing protein [Quisquiliibacterium transsilvanicum]